LATLPPRHDLQSAARCSLRPPREPGRRRQLARRYTHLLVVIQALVPASSGFLTLSGVAPTAYADSPSAPVGIQAQILTRVLPYDRGFAARAQQRVVILLAHKAGDPDSVSAANQMERELGEIGTVANSPIQLHRLSYSDAAQLAAECRARGAHAVYVSSGLSEQVPLISNAISGLPVLSFGAVESYVPRGMVLGVEVVNGKPRMSINLPRAKAQKLNFSAALLKLAKVYQ
jgi:hypothetical protein